jgi:hypothetical protein
MRILQDERKAFEKWFEEDAMPSESGWFERDNDGSYVLGYVDAAWNGWNGKIYSMQHQCNPIRRITQDGWTDWQSPVMKGYLMQCCDCGLIHEMDFQVVRYVGEKDSSGNQMCDPINDIDIQALFRCKRRDDLSSPQPSLTQTESYNHKDSE